MGVNSESVTDARVPHISLVFREMWGTTNLDRNFLLGVKACGARAVVSHISRKTSEMWGTRGSVADPDALEQRVFPRTVKAKKG
jgi:hypothetical protein